MKKSLYAALCLVLSTLVVAACDTYTPPLDGSPDDEAAPNEVHAIGKTYHDFNDVIPTNGSQQASYTVRLDTQGKLFGDPLANYVYTLSPLPDARGIEHFSIQLGDCAGPGYSSPPGGVANGPNSPSSTTIGDLFSPNWPGKVIQWRFPQNDPVAVRTVQLDVVSAPFIGWGYFELKTGAGQVFVGKLLVPCMNTRTETFAVFQDVNRNETRDAAEAGIAGFTLQLLDDDNSDGNGMDYELVAEETTNSSGVATFTGILDPGSYVVQVPVDPTGPNQDKLVDYLAVGSTGASTVLNPSFGFDLSKILGKVVLDPEQGDNTLPDTEVAIADVTVFATRQNCTESCVFSGRTGVDGSYVIDNLPAGDYIVSVPPATATGDDFNEQLVFFFDATFPAPDYTYQVTVGPDVVDDDCFETPQPAPTDFGKSCGNNFGFNADRVVLNQVIDDAEAGVGGGSLTTADYKFWVKLARQMCSQGATTIVSPQIPGGSYELQSLLDDINSFAYAAVPSDMVGACALKMEIDRPINNFEIELRVAITIAQLNFFLPGFDLCVDGNCDPTFVRAFLQNAEAEFIERVVNAPLGAKPEACGSTCDTLNNYSGGGGGGGTGFE